MLFVVRISSKQGPWPKKHSMPPAVKTLTEDLKSCPRVVLCRTWGIFSPMLPILNIGPHPSSRPLAYLPSNPQPQFTSSFTWWSFLWILNQAVIHLNSWVWSFNTLKILIDDEVKYFCDFFAPSCPPFDDYDRSLRINSLNLDWLWPITSCEFK